MLYKLFTLSLIGLFSILFITACATKRYGRMSSVSVAEKQHYDLKDIEIEIAKVKQFVRDVEEGAEFDFKSVLGFLGDYGIGNAMEKDAAMRSARERLEELEAIKLKLLAEASE